MARRKSKKKQQEEFLKGLFGLAGLGSFFITFYLTQSFNISVGVAIVSVAIVISVMIMLYLKKIERLKKSGISDIDKMEGTQFENYLQHLFRAQGYNAKVTQPVGDFGADLIISKDGKKIAVQAKRYSKNVGVKAVQEAQEAQASIAHYGAAEGWVITNADYTESAQSLARSNQIKLINRDELIDMILHMKVESKSKPIASEFKKTPQSSGLISEIQQNGSKCSRCGNELILRKGSKGEFYGCSSFPKCRFTLPLNN